MRFTLDLDQLFHQLVVDVQTSGGVYQKRVRNQHRELASKLRASAQADRSSQVFQRSIGQSLWR